MRARSTRHANSAPVCVLQGSSASIQLRPIKAVLQKNKKGVYTSSAREMYLVTIKQFLPGRCVPETAFTNPCSCKGRHQWWSTHGLRCSRIRWPRCESGVVQWWASRTDMISTRLDTLYMWTWSPNPATARVCLYYYFYRRTGGMTAQRVRLGGLDIQTFPRQLQPPCRIREDVTSRMT